MHALPVKLVSPDVCVLIFFCLSLPSSHYPRDTKMQEYTTDNFCLTIPFSSPNTTFIGPLRGSPGDQLNPA